MDNREVGHQLETLHEARHDIQKNFIVIGQILAEIKQSKLHRMKGYEKFNEFVEAEHSISRGMASKLIKLYVLYAAEMSMGDEEIEKIGMDRLLMIYPIISKADIDVQQEWIEQASENNYTDLKQKVKEYKEEQKGKDVDLKDVFIDQYKEKMVTFFNCSKKEVDFKLALYFQDADLDKVKMKVREMQRQFEEALRSPVIGE